jgi:hypothetical protein
MLGEGMPSRVSTWTKAAVVVPDANPGEVHAWPFHREGVLAAPLEVVARRIQLVGPCTQGFFQLAQGDAGRCARPTGFGPIIANKQAGHVGVLEVTEGPARNGGWVRERAGQRLGRRTVPAPRRSPVKAVMV